MKSTHRQPPAPLAFTLMEILVVLLIILALMALIVPALNYARRYAQTAATQALLNTLAQGLDTYYGTPEFKSTYPPSMPFNYGVIPNPRGSVMLAQGLTGFLQYSADGAGPSFSYGGVTDPVYGFRLHTGGHGNIYGPYVPTDNPATFRPVPGTLVGGIYNEQVFIDRWGNEILYYRAVPAVIKGTGGLPDTPRQITSIFAHWTKYPTPPDSTFTGIFVIEDNLFVKDQNGNLVPSTGNLDPSAATDMHFWNTLGCYSSPNAVNPGDVIVGADNYLLISAGPDGVYFSADDIIQVRK